MSAQEWSAEKVAEVGIAAEAAEQLRDRVLAAVNRLEAKRTNLMSRAARARVGSNERQVAALLASNIRLYAVELVQNAKLVQELDAEGSLDLAWRPLCDRIYDIVVRRAETSSRA